MQWACLFLPQLALDAVLRRRDDPGAPFALVSGPLQRRVLHAVNPSARALGLRPGMPLAQAQAIGARFEMEPHDAAACERARELVAAWAYGYSSQVSLALPHAVVLEVARSLRLFGPWPNLEARLREGLRWLGCRHRVVLAPHPHAAHAIAHVQDSVAVGSRELPVALGRIPVERAGFAREVGEAFWRMGLRQLGQVRGLPRATLARRFPSGVLHHLDRLYGDVESPLPLYRPPDRFEARIEFEQEVESSLRLLFPLRRLTADLAAFLLARDGGVQRFVLRMEHERLPPTDVRIGLLSAEREAAMLFELARGRLEQARVPAPVRALLVVAEELPPFVPAAGDLFDTRTQQAMPWPRLRERLRARLGDEAVRDLGWRAEHRPEFAVTQGPQRPVPLPPLPRPGWLLRNAVPWRDRGLRVLAGPERIEAGWWDGREVRRDYYLVETRDGQRAWVYCSVGATPPGLGEDVMLHGWFA
jgi:protein ImuB